MSDPPQLTVGSLFSGAGGFDLGLERAGMKVIWQSEIDPAANYVLRKHWPNVRNYGDIRSIDGGKVRRPDVICGGFPCQPFSSAARGRNLDGNLWPEMHRLIRRLRPTWVIGENVAHIDRMALRQVEADLETSGYAIIPFEIPACGVGLDHKRPRLWILGHTNSYSEPGCAIHAQASRVPRPDDDTGGMGVAYGIPSRLDRMRLMGNGLVPAIAEIIGRAIIESEGTP